MTTKKIQAVLAIAGVLLITAASVAYAELSERQVGRLRSAVKERGFADAVAKILDHVDDVTYSVGAEAANAITVTVAFLNAQETATDQNSAQALVCYLSDVATGIGVTPTAADGGLDEGVVAGNAGKTDTIVAGKIALVMSDTDGDASVKVTHTGTDNYFLCCPRGNNDIDCSAVIDFN